ncbi:globin family protein [Lusitaniella coriacea]|uniref:globin family protein n=1 Tax=Lusitaniella coriacea TaxID=1983105 RepID=UPI003CEDF50B
MALQVELLEASFARIKERQTDFTDCFYAILFKDYPDVKPLFAHVSMDDQSKKLFDSLALVVRGLRNPEALMEPLKGLGTRHVQYGAVPAHYPAVGATLLQAFANILQEDWTSEVEWAWANAYSIIAEIMLEGSEYPPELLQPKALVERASL